MAHWSGCLFYGVGNIENRNTELNWISKNNLNDVPTLEKYVNALYWSITTMSTVGYGDIKLASSKEIIVVCIVEIIAGITFAFNIGGIG